MAPRHIVLVTGLKREARILGCESAHVIIGGGHSRRLAQDIEQAIADGADAILSMGIAGGLRPGLRPGSVVVAAAVVANEARIPTTAAWSDELNRALPDAIRGDITGADRIVAEVSAKAALHQASGAAAVDMESHIVAQIAHRHGIPFAVVRVVADPAERALPPAAQAGFASDGTVNVRAVISALVASPGQTLALVQTARDARAAFRALYRCRRLLGAGFCFPDFGELQVDMP